MICDGFTFLTLKSSGKYNPGFPGLPWVMVPGLSKPKSLLQEFPKI